MTHPPAFGRYEVKRLLGEGGFGQVFLARDPVLARDVAIKVPREEWWSGDQALAEARALASLSHPGIVQVLDAGLTDGRAFIVLEHVDGEDLEAFVGRLALRARRFAPEAALALLALPAEGIDHAHASGLLHRDLKPANLLVPRGTSPSRLGRSELGEAARADVKVADFGLCALAAKHGPTSAGAGEGDPRYAAPEAWRGRPDRSSDVHAVAAIFFELVAGRSPLPGESPAEQVAAAASGDRLRLADVVQGVPSSLDQALARALSPRRHERPATAVALLADLSAALRQDEDRRRLVDDARQRIQSRESRAPSDCLECGAPLHPRAHGCPHCGAG